ncbi:MAG: class I SAM-dependent methyltransferase [Streptosporangiaceae bacterium]
MTADAPAISASRWEGNAEFWIRIIREHRDRYRTELTDQAVLTAVGPCHGLDVLDAGCGEGYMAREIARRGARQVTGVDKSPALVAAARAASADLPAAHFSEADVVDLPFADDSFDLAIANHLLNDLPDIVSPVGELARVLRPGGRLAVLMLHPCFYGNRAERQEIRRTLPVADYFAARVIEQRFEVDGIVSPDPTVTWVRPLEAYAAAITGNGLCITGVAEPHPSDDQLAASQWWRENFPRPLFLLLTAAKRGTGEGELPLARNR